MNHRGRVETLQVVLLVLLMALFAVQLVLAWGERSWPGGAGPMVTVLLAVGLLETRAARLRRRAGARGVLLVGVLAVAALVVHVGVITERGLPAAWFELVCVVAVVVMATGSLASTRRPPPGVPARAADLT